MKKKKPTTYRAYNGCKSTIELTLANLMIALEYKWNNESKLRGSDHFPIIIEDEREVSIKQHQRCRIVRAIGCSFRKKEKLQQKCRTKIQWKKHTAEKTILVHGLLGLRPPLHIT